MKNNLSFKAVRSDLAVLFEPLTRFFSERTDRYPKSCVAIMVLLMACSALAGFTVLRKSPEQNSRKISFPSSAISSGLSSASSLMSVLSLQSQLSEFLNKPELSQKDSLRMEEILLEINQLQNNIRHEKNRP